MTLIALFNLVEMDHRLFELLNSEWTNVFFDWLLPVWRDKLFWLPVYFFILTFMIYNYGRKAYWFILFLIATVGTADYVSSQVIKKSIERIRPCNDNQLDQVRTLVRCGSGYSFTSSHAANHFALSIFLLTTIGIRFAKIRGWLLAWAASVSYAQVYVGVHYPLDVICGMILGILIARLFVWLYHKSGKAIAAFA